MLEVDTTMAVDIEILPSVVVRACVRGLRDILTFTGLAGQRR